MIIGISGRIGAGKDTVGKIIKEKIDLKHNWEIKKFAGKLKQIISLLTGIPVEDLEKQEVKDRVLGKEWSRYAIIDRNLSVVEVIEHLDEGVDFFSTLEEAELNYPNKARYYSLKQDLSVRELLQRCGTEAMRGVIHSNIWVNALFSEYKDSYVNITSKEDANRGVIPIVNMVKKECNWIITDVRFPNEADAILERNGILIRVERSDIPSSTHSSETALNYYSKFTETIENNGSIEELTQKVKTVLQKHKLI